MARKKASGTLEIALPNYVRSIGEMRGEWIEDTETKLRELLAIATSYDNDVAAARNDPDLSSTGRAREADQVAAGALVKLDEWKKRTVGGLKSHIAGVEQEIFKLATPKRPTDPAERIAYELQLQEIRRDLRQLDDLDRWLLYSSTDDPMIVDAIDTAPPIITKTGKASARIEPFIDPEKRAAVMLERVRAANPEAADRLAALQALDETYRIAASGVYQAILADAPGAREREAMAQAVSA